MADAVRRTEYYYATVPDEPGAGARVLAQLQQARVNLAAYLGFPSGKGQSQIDLVPEDAGALKQAADKAGLKLTGPKRAFLIQGDDRVGAVADVARKLGEAKVNITAAAAASAGGGRYGMVLWVPEADYEKAAKALGA
jgi:hypothetical protein